VTRTRPRSPRQVGKPGILVVHNDPVPEAEIWRTAPPWCDVVTGRFTLNRAPGEEYRGERASDFLTSEVRRTLADLVNAGADALALCFVSASVFGGTDFDHEFAETVRARTGVYAFTAGQALREQLRWLAPSRPLVMAPPWFTDRTVEATLSYLGLNVSSTPTGRFELDQQWDVSTRQDLFDRGAKSVIDQTGLREQILAQADQADLVLIPGSGFRTLQAAEAVRTELGIPVITANSAVLDHYLRLCR
jgi:maleate isomerase